MVELFIKKFTKSCTLVIAPSTEIESSKITKQIKNAIAANIPIVSYELVLDLCNNGMKNLRLNSQIQKYLVKFDSTENQGPFPRRIANKFNDIILKNLQDQWATEIEDENQNENQDENQDEDKDNIEIPRKKQKLSDNIHIPIEQRFQEWPKNHTYAERRKKIF